MTTQIRGNKQIKDISITNEQIAQNAAIETSKLAEGAELLKRDGSVAATGNINLNQHQLKNVAAPVDDTDAARKVDLDSSVSNLQSDIDSLDVRVGDLEAHDVVQDGRLDTAEADIAAIESNIVTIQAKDVEQDGRLSSIESKNTQQDNRLTQAESDIDALEAADAALDTRVSNLEDGLQAETSARQSADSALDGRLDVAEADIAQLQADLAEATNGAFITREVPVGAINGSNKVFTLAFSPNAGSEQVFINGSLLNPGASNDYVINDTVITFAVAPEAGDVVFANYIHDAIIVGTGSGSGGSGGATNLNGLTDVTITSPAADQVLKFNGTQWVNATVPSGDTSAIEADIAALDTRVDVLETSGIGTSMYDSVIREIPSGAVNGSNAVFTLANTPLANTEQVFLNGVLQQPGAGNDYTISGSTITFTVAPDANWKVAVSYMIDAGPASVDLTQVNADIAALDSRVDVLEAVVPFSGSYNDLTNKPTIPSLTQVESDISALQSADVALDSRLDSAEASLLSLDGRVDALEAVTPFSGSYNDLTNKPSLFSGSYDDLTNKPTIPSLTQVESDISSLQSADVVLDARVDALEAADVALDSRVDALEAADISLDSRLDTAEATLISLDSRVDSLEASGVSGGSGGVGAIEVFQDSEFIWSGSDTYRNITHNKGRQPDMVKVFVKTASSIWVEHYDLSAPAGSGANYGYYNLVAADDNNSTKIRLFNNNVGGSSPTRIRLYWFGSNDVGTASAGAFSVGGGSAKYETTITHTGSFSGTYHTITHNLGTTDVDVKVLHREGTSNNYAVLTDYMYAPDWSRYGFFVRNITTTTLELFIAAWFPAVVSGSEFATKQAKVIVTKL